MPMQLLRKIRLAAKYLHNIGIINTLRANFTLLPLSDAVKLPILVFRGTELIIAKTAKITFKCPIRFGLLRLGAIDALQIPRGSHSYISLSGGVIICGSTRYGYNAKLIVNRGATLSFGGDNVVNHDSHILAHNKITLDYGARVGWNVQICDSAFHYVDVNGTVSAKTKPVTIGRQAWVSSFCNVTRGAVLPDFSVLSTCSLLNKDYSQAGTRLLIAGIPAKIIKTGVSRIMEFAEPDLCQSIDNYFALNPDANTIDISYFTHENR